MMCWHRYPDRDRGDRHDNEERHDRGAGHGVVAIISIGAQEMIKEDNARRSSRVGGHFSADFNPDKIKKRSTLYEDY